MKSYTDQSYGTTVRRLTGSGDNLNFYYHQPSVLGDSGEILILHFARKGYFSEREILAVNYRTGEARIASDKGELISEYLHEGKIYGFLCERPGDLTETLLGCQDAVTGEVTRFQRVGGDGFVCSGAVGVSGDGRYLLYQSERREGPRTLRVSVYDRETSENRVLYEGAEDYQHFVFAPEGPVFYAVHQNAPNSKGRMTFWNAETGEKRILNLRGPYVDADGYGFVHPVFAGNGDLLLDGIWHPREKRGFFRYMLLPRRIYESREIFDESECPTWFAPCRNWNIHYVPTAYGGWYVGSGGDNQGYVFGRMEINLFRLMPSGGVQYYWLAEKRGKNLDHPGVCAAVPDDLSCVVFAQRFDGEHSTDEANIFAADVPEAVRAEAEGRTLCPLIDVDPLTKNEYFGRYGDLAVYNPAGDDENVAKPGYSVSCRTRAGRKVWRRNAGGEKCLGRAADCVSDYCWAGTPLEYEIEAEGPCRLSAYFINYEENGRRTTVWLEDGLGNTVSCPAEVTDYPEGVYYTFRISGRVILKALCRETSAVLSGLLLSSESEENHDCKR